MRARTTKVREGSTRSLCAGNAMLTCHLQVSGSRAVGSLYSLFSWKACRKIQKRVAGPTPTPPPWATAALSSMATRRKIGFAFLLCGHECGMMLLRHLDWEKASQTGGCSIEQCAWPSTTLHSFQARRLRPLCTPKPHSHDGSKAPPPKTIEVPRRQCRLGLGLGCDLCGCREVGPEDCRRGCSANTSKHGAACLVRVL